MLTVPNYLYVWVPAQVLKTRTKPLSPGGPQAWPWRPMDTAEPEPDTPSVGWLRWGPALSLGGYLAGTQSTRSAPRRLKQGL